MKWSEAPENANFLLTLEGGTKVFSETNPTEVEVLGVKIPVTFFEQRPEWKTKLHLKYEGKLVEYESEGMISHATAKRMLRDAGYDVRGLRFMLEYEKIV